MFRLTKTSLVLSIVFVADFLTNLEMQGTVVIAGIHIYMFDIISLSLIALSFPYWISIRGKSKPEILLISLFWISIVAFLTGLRENSLAAGVAYRQDFIVFSLMFYLASSRHRISLRSLILIITFYSFFGILVGFLREFGIVQLSTYVINMRVGAESFISHRLIGINHSLAIAGMSLIFFTVAVTGHVKGNRRLTAAIIAIMALALSFSSMNRSVWLAAICGIFTLFVATKWHGSIKGKAQFYFVVGVVLACGASFLWYMQSQYLIQAVSEVFKEQSTANWRIVGWQGLIDKVTGLHILWGMGYGADQTRIVFDEEINSSAHNLFVHIYFYMGLIGLSLYLMFMYGILKGLRKIQTKAREYEIRNLASSLIVLFVLLFVYHMAYSQYLLDSIVYGYSLRLICQYNWKYRTEKPILRNHVPRSVPGYGYILNGRN